MSRTSRSWHSFRHRAVVSVGVRPLVLRPRLIDVNDFRRMNLVNGHERRAGKDGGDGPSAVLVDRRAVVIASIAHIEACELASRNAAPAAEEAVSDVAKRLCATDFNAAQSLFRMMMSSST